MQAGPPLRRVWCFGVLVPQGFFKDDTGIQGISYIENETGSEVNQGCLF